MNTIELVNTLPRVFAGQPGIQSEVWLKTLRFERGKKYLISAESGCGKSSLCAYLYGYRKDYEGTFLFDGRSIDELTVEEWCDVRRRHIAYLPQEMRLFPELTALENVELKNRLTGHKTTAEIRSLFERLGVADRADRPAGKLSIGQQQRVAIARALASPAKVLLADEPTGNLDSASSREIMEILKGMHRSGETLILITHDNGIAAQAKRVVRIMDGKIESDMINEEFVEEA